jgi:hypothetical protein
LLSAPILAPFSQTSIRPAAPSTSTLTLAVYQSPVVMPVVLNVCAPVTSLRVASLPVALRKRRASGEPEAVRSLSNEKLSTWLSSLKRSW